MNASEILYKAAALIRKDGWCIGLSRSEFGEHCIAGAIREVASGDAFYGQVPEATKPIFRGVLDSLLGDASAVVQFNNNECASKLDAVAFLLIAGDLAVCEEHK